MGFIHGLAVVLIIFEGMIIQCKSTAPVDTTSLIQNAPIIEISEDKQLLPNHLIELIVSYTDFETAQKIVRSQIINATKTVMSRILQDRIIVIDAFKEYEGSTHEYYDDGELFLVCGSYPSPFVSLFNRFGDQVKKIEIFYDRTGIDDRNSQINKNITNRCVNNLEELRIRTSNDEGIWEEMSNEDNGIIFPEVKKFQFLGKSSRKEFKLNLIFPKLESFKLIGSVSDRNCLANITTLKELKLCSKSIEEHQLAHIFANNKNMTTIALDSPVRAETMHSIAKDLTKLETLVVEYPGRDFMFRSNNRGSYELKSVIHFDNLFRGMSELIGDLSFDMPHLKKLSLKGWRIDNQIVKFINSFKELETVEVLQKNYHPIKCMEILKHIKELTAYNFEKCQLCSLRNFFQHFDEESKLQTLKLWFVVTHKNEPFHKYEATMQRINIGLAKSKKPTWTLSLGQQNGVRRKYLIFERER